ncbi:hypothetical protein [Roseiflexus castenholzii]|uniref:hypothetical protein n=1 Tax=Roseiflexus castenholzii TaxID=120962 RepID=UPI003C7E3435
MNVFAHHTTNGFIDHWLVAGPRVLEAPNLDRFYGYDFRVRIARHYATPAIEIAPPSAEGDTFEADGQELTWQYYACGDDHFVDLSDFYHLVSHLRAWAYAEVVTPNHGRVGLTITTNGPADVWINGCHVHHQEHVQPQIPASVPFTADLRQGANAILVRFEAVAARECPMVMALRVDGVGELPVQLPTHQRHIELRAAIEQVIAAAFLERDVFDSSEEIVVRWSPDATFAERTVCVRLQNARGQIFAEALPTVRPGAAQSFGRAAQLRDGAYQILLMPHPETYYLHNVRVTRAIPFEVLKNRYAAAPYGVYEARRIEALRDAVQRGGLYGEIAKMELGAWDTLNLDVILHEIDGINRRRDCSDFYLIGLLGALLRYGNDERFPATLREPLEACILGFRYWADEPGVDAMWFWSENHRILFHTCEILAGQIYPDRIFTNSGLSGEEHRLKGERLALDWLRSRATGGFREWDSNTYFEHDALALSHLADLTANDEVSELATVVLDKLLFTMAINSFRGVFGSTHGRAYTVGIKGARRELTSGMSRLLWGMGTFNQATLGTVALACARGYALPSVIAEIATASVEELWHRERHAGVNVWDLDMAEGPWEVNKVTFKTPDYMLCSAQDHHPGERGVQQHIWQATLSHDAVVFVTHPPCIAEDNSHRPNAWHGHVVLPRVAQWRETLIAIHHIPPRSDWFDHARPDGYIDPAHPQAYVDPQWMGWTHAYFPTFAFDEYALREGWAFARVGNGYLALTAANGLTLVTTGRNAFRELRSPGWPNSWVCMMGRAARDGDFAAFQERTLALRVAFDNLWVHCETLRGDRLAFGWEGPLLVNNEEQPLNGFRHYDSPICTCEMGATSMDIIGWETVLRLDFT